MAKLVKIQWDELEAALEDDDFIGFCLACTAIHYGIEPDARNYRCEECDENTVYGAQEILFMEAYEE